MLKICNITYYHHYPILIFHVCYLPVTCMKLVFISQSKPFISPIRASIIQFRHHTYSLGGVIHLFIAAVSLVRTLSVVTRTGGL